MNPFTLVSGGVLHGERYDFRKVTMLDLIQAAWQVEPETVIGGPNWLEFDRFDVAGKAPAGTPPETVRLMLQSMLAERFHLAVHKDMRPLPAFALSKGNGKPKMTASAGGTNSGCTFMSQRAGSTVMAWSCRNITMAAFAPWVRETGSEYLKEPVVDETGLEGSWDFDIQWTRRSALLPAGAERTTVYDAISRQLGLNLTLQDAPAPVLVVDKVEKPSPNAPDVAQKLPPRQLAFEVADVKLNKTDEPDSWKYTRGGGIELRHARLDIAMGFAWDISTVHTHDWIFGFPKGADSTLIDVEAKAAKQPNGPAHGNSGYDDDLRAMLRALLTERFGIKWHYENRPVEAYSIVAAKPKLKKADSANRASCHDARNLANDPRDANPLLASVVSCRNVTIAQFASTLQKLDDFQFAYPVEDATGLDGRWDFDLSFTPGEMYRNSLRGSGGPAAEPNGAVSFPDAVSKLGLRLEKRKRMLPVVVIDHMELTPTGN
jgi:uncharacterized protein (TIGR03435 family)